MIGLLLAVAAASAPCVKSIQLEGDPAVIAQIRKHLREPAAESAAGECGVLAASASKVGDVLVIVADGKTLAVHRPKAAAAWLESRIRPDLAAPLLELAISGEALEVPEVAQAPIETERAEAVAGPSVSGDEARSDEPTVPRRGDEAPPDPKPPANDHGRHGGPVLGEARAETARIPAPDAVGLEIAGRAEIGWSELGSELGAAGVASLPIGFVDALLIVRGAATGTVQPVGFSATRAWSTEALAGLRLPWRFAGIVVAPGVGAGVGVDFVSRDRCSGCLPVVQDEASTTRAALRTEGFLDTSVPVAGGFALALSLSGSVSPFASGDPTLPSWIPPGTPGADHLALPTARGRIRLGAGLSWRGR